MRLVHIHQLSVALVFASFLPEASAQCYKRACPRERLNPQNQTRPPGPIIARGTRQESKPTGVAASWNVLGAKPVRYDGLGLRILSGTPQRRLATVNDQTFAAGESLRVTVRGTSLRVRCLEIRDRSVLVDVQGEGPRELKLLASWQQ